MILINNRYFLFNDYIFIQQNNISKVRIKRLSIFTMLILKILTLISFVMLILKF